MHLWQPKGQKPFVSKAAVGRMAYDITQTDYWRKWRQGVPGGHYSRRKRNNDLRWAARHNAKHEGGLFGRARWLAKGGIREARKNRNAWEEQDRQLRLAVLGR